MEVHHHPQVEKKNFKEYFLEGLMIFLAVTMGFIAENIRERISDNAKEREYIASFIRNLTDDTTGIASVIKENETKVNGLQKLVSFSHKDLSAPAIRQDFYEKCAIHVSYYSLFKSNDATMQQLKNSGLRFIKNPKAADSIARYDIKMNALYSAGNLYERATDQAIEASHKVFDNTIFYDSSYFFNRNFTGKPLPLLTRDPVQQRIFFNAVVFEIGATKNYLNNLNETKPFINSVLAFLKKEYHFDQE